METQILIVLGIITAVGMPLLIDESLLRSALARAKINAGAVIGRIRNGG